MDFLQNFLNIENIVLGIVGIIGIVGFVASIRLMRQGTQSFETRHEAIDARIKETAQSMRDKNNAMQSFEQLHIVAVALKDALNLKGYNGNDIITEHEHHISLKLAQSTVNVFYLAKSSTLRSSKRLVHGQGTWEVRQDDVTIETFSNIMQLEKYLLTRLREEIL